MLSAIRSSIIEIVSLSEEMIDEPSSKEYRRWLTVRTYLHEHDFIQNSTVCMLLNISPATANRLLRGWAEEEKLEHFRHGKIYAYRMTSKEGLKA
ncbi:MAG: hypothetical protein LUE97_06155 [Oscillospiraceae bacterium]|nr:hypothetical protein [Oscillospiraceae bacterium]